VEPRTVFSFVSPDYGSSITEDGCCGSGCCDYDADITIAELDGIAAAVEERYAGIATNATARGANASYIKSTDKYYSAEQRAALHPDAAGAAAGCGNPVEVAEARPGETVLDLGSGSGVDCFLIASDVGPEGRVIGIDMTPKMLELASDIAEQKKAHWVSFKKGQIEMVPQGDKSVDLVISNSSIVLSENKPKVYSEILRILKPGGRFVISDVVTDKPLPQNIQDSAAEWVSCVGGAEIKNEYLEMIEAVGFTNIEVLNGERAFPTDPGWRSSLVNITLRAYKSAE
jgi:arsenite methyltransferase